MKYLGIQSLRGIAALAVVVHHFDVMNAKEKYFGQQLFGFIGESGFRGVDLFFVISGFILMHSSNESPERSRLEFALNRIIRIFVPYLPIFTALTLIYILNPNIAQGGISIDLKFLVNNLLLLPRESLESYVPVVAWTLTYELTFYLIFSMTIVRGNSLSISLFVIWMTICFINIWSKNVLMLFDPLNLAFGCGIVAYYGRHLIRWRSHYIFTTVAFAGIILIMKFGNDRGVNPLVDIVFIMLSGLLCSTCFAIKLNKLSRLGDFSYSLYLCHYPIIALSYIAAFKLMQNINPYLMTFLITIITLYASFIYSKVFEIYLSNEIRLKIVVMTQKLLKKLYN